MKNTIPRVKVLNVKGSIKVLDAILSLGLCCLKNKVYILCLQGNIIRGKPTTTEAAKPILINWSNVVDGKFLSTFPSTVFKKVA